MGGSRHGLLITVLGPRPRLRAEALLERRRPGCLELQRRRLGFGRAARGVAATFAPALLAGRLGVMVQRGFRGVSGRAEQANRGFRCPGPSWTSGRGRNVARIARMARMRKVRSTMYEAQDVKVHDKFEQLYKTMACSKSIACSKFS